MSKSLLKLYVYDRWQSGLGALLLHRLKLKKGYVFFVFCFFGSLKFDRFDCSRFE